LIKNISIIYENDDLLVVNKPVGLLVHPTLKSTEDTLVDWLVKKYPKIKKVGDDPELRPGIVHRLDRDTSGVLIVAKTQETFEYLKNQFQDRKISKKYITLVHKNIKKDEGVIDLPIGKSKGDFRKKSVRGNLRGNIREAVTEFKVLERFTVDDDRYTFVEVFPKTGRTHQIRVHLNAIGNPVVCDSLYGPKKKACPFGLKRQFLHAQELKLTVSDGYEKTFEAPLSDDLDQVLKVLKEHC